MNHTELIPNLFKSEYRKIVSVLCKLFGTVHIEIAEDITNDTFLLASETWGLKGIPANPKAWLYLVAKNKTKDYLRRNKLFTHKIKEEIRDASSDFYEPEIDLSDRNIKDSQLQMIFAICTPLISKETQVGLALRILCGFGIEEISQAFLTNKETINKRLFRGKEKLRIANLKIEFPDQESIDERLENVLTTIYLLFNEGYYSSTQHKILRKELCMEAMRLTALLLENELTNKPNVNALMSLMCFHASRFEARVSECGDYLLYAEQDRDKWNSELVLKGEYFLNESATGDRLTKYHLEAAIAFWHTEEEGETSEKWENILQLYNHLLQLEYSPIAALNRTYALAMANGKQEAIEEALKINLVGNHLYHSLLAALYEGVDSKKQLAQLQLAIGCAKMENDQKVILSKIEKISG
ncbi:sigma-70 family RNA polymerase sigma factor [Flammeovirgaceae bacterium SG7u.111]|nr:sigma-70 family RNA polymerase sigma factor [Flammeovirgaceae bacterium SG7u.132]WPO37309.1 sigma-70 family RNA polymerase sigma factor [Flammeovirgaceae bacterium SG7u.111]